MRTLTTTKGNPANAIHDNYARLMTITNLDELKTEALALGKKGFSKKNLAKFVRAVNEANSVTRLQFFLTNFLLAADGLSVSRAG